MQFVNLRWQLKNAKTQIVSRNFCAFLNTYSSKTHLIKSLNSLDSSRPYKRMLENQKMGLYKTISI